MSTTKYCRYAMKCLVSTYCKAFFYQGGNIVNRTFRALSVLNNSRFGVFTKEYCTEKFSESFSGFSKVLGGNFVYVMFT